MPRAVRYERILLANIECIGEKTFVYNTLEIETYKYYTSGILLGFIIYQETNLTNISLFKFMDIIQNIFGIKLMYIV